MAGKYRPSNGTEGEAFIYNWCSNCIHGKYEHDQSADSCDIVTMAMCFDLNDKEYPNEWRYNSEGKAVCTAFVKWDWGKDEGDGLNEPPIIEPDDPNQLVMPFILNEIETKIIDINKNKEKEIIKYVLENTKSF
jgi:hypothetical protein